MEKAIILVLLTHFIGDQVIQPMSVRYNKYDSLIGMMFHVLFWCVPMFGVSLYAAITLKAIEPIGMFLLATILHYIIDLAFVKVISYGKSSHSALSEAMFLLNHLIVNLMLIFFVEKTIYLSVF